jgi:2-polyprenyl-6-methoxyphenol hydroxylase-like FAD-dependent oxidoreductase
MLAALLGQEGYRVLLLDRARFPSDTLSTHFFRAPALRAFQQAGVGDEVLASAPHLIVNYNAIDGIVFPEPMDGPEDYPFYMCVRRILLDDILTRHVRNISCVTLREGAKVAGLARDGGRVVGVRWQESNQNHEATAKAVVGADGVNSFVAREVRPQLEHTEPVNRAMYYAYYRGIAPHDGPAAEFHYRGNNMVYCFPCDHELTLLAASVPIAEFASFKRDPETRFTEELRAMSALAPRLDTAAREGPIRGTGSIPGWLRVPFGEGWALVGDAGMIMDPWSGQGIDQASTHAVYLAGHLAQFLSGTTDWDQAMQAYHHDRNTFSRKTYERTCRFSRDLRPMTRAALAKRGLQQDAS